MHISALYHLFEDLYLGILVLQLRLEVLECGLGQLADLDLSLEQLLAIFIGKGSLPAHLPLQVLDLGVFLDSLLLQLVEALVFALYVLCLILDQHFQVILVVQNLLEVFLNGFNEELVLLESLLKGLVLLFEGANALFDLPELAVCLGQQLLQLHVFIVGLALKTLQPLYRVVPLRQLPEQRSLALLILDLHFFEVGNLLSLLLLFLLMDFYLVGQRQHLRLLLEQGPVLRLKVGLDL